MDTEPLPQIPPSDPAEVVDETPDRGAGRRADRPVAGGRLRGFAGVIEAAAGLASGGLVLIGVGLVVLQFLAPDIAPGTGLAQAQGPGWERIAIQLGVGVAGEIVVLIRPRSRRGPRVWMAVLVLLAAAVALWWCWWR